VREQLGSARHVLVLGQERSTHGWNRPGTQAQSDDLVGRPGAETSAHEAVSIDNNTLYIPHRTENITLVAATGAKASRKEIWDVPITHCFGHSRLDSWKQG
jgi:hypothetical protein